MSDLRKTIKKYRNEGRLDSQGVFTTNQTRAVGKLAAWQLPRPSAWILKVLQAAISSGSSQVVVKQSRRDTVIVFDASEPVELEELSDALKSMKAGSSRTIRSLAAGLRSVGLGQSRPFRIQSAGAVLGWNCKELSLGLLPEDSRSIQITVEFPPGSRGRIIGNLFRSLGVASDEYLEVVHSAEASPIPIKFDGRRIDTFALPAEDAKFGQSWCVVRGWNSAESLNLPSIALPYGLKAPGACVPDFLGGSDSEAFSLVGSDSTEVAILFKLFLNFYTENKQTVEGVPKKSHVSWMEDGIITQFQSFPITSALSFELYLSGEGLKADVSGMGLIQTQAMDDRRSAALRLLREQLSQLQSAVKAVGSIEHSILARIFRFDSIKREKQMQKLLGESLDSLIRLLKAV